MRAASYLAPMPSATGTPHLLACVLGFTLSLTLTFPLTRYLCAYICWPLGREETGGPQQGLIEAPPQQLDSLDRTLQP